MFSALAFGWRSAVIDWRSPLQDDDYVEYFDQAFLDRLGAGELTMPLDEFWPRSGPRWDGLARTMDGKLILVEAKAHIDEAVDYRSKSSPGARQEWTPFTFIHYTSDIAEDGLQIYKCEGRPPSTARASPIHRYDYLVGVGHIAVSQPPPEGRQPDDEQVAVRSQLPDGGPPRLISTCRPGPAA